MKHIIFLLLIPFFGFSQGGTWPVKYNDSDPSGAPSAAGTRIYFNTATNTLWFWEPAPSSTWRKQPKGFDQISGCAAPAYTPTARQSTFAVNSCTVPELYQYTGSAWVQLNGGATYTAGTGIAINGSNVISNTGDLSATNELNTSISVSGSNLQIIDAGGTLTVPVSSIAPVQAVAAGTGISISGTTTRTVTNSAPDQTVVLNNGTGISTSGTYPNFTIASTITQADGSETKINVGTGLSKSGSGTTGSPYVLTNTAPNVVQTLSIAGQDLTLSGGGGTVEIPGGASDALGTGFTSGGGSGTIPAGTTIGGAPDFQGIVTLSGGTNVTGPADFYSDVTFSGSPIFGDGLRAPYFIQGGPGGDNGLYIDNTDGAETISLSVVDVTRLQIDNTGLAIFSGGIQPAQYTNGDAPNNCIFYSTTDSKLSYKDPGGTVHNLY